MFGKAEAGELVEAADAARYYRPTLIAGIAASIGIIIGSITPWLHVFVISANGLDIDGWGKATLVLGAASGVALVSNWDWARATSSLEWAIPLVWGAFVAGVACLALALINIVRFTSISAEVFEGTFGVRVEWGLWLVALSALVLCATAATAAVRVGKGGVQRSSSLPQTQEAAWVWAAVIGSVAILLCAALYVWARQISGYDNSFWLRLFEQHLGM